MNVDVHAVPPAGSTNSPSTVNSSPRALSAPAACRRDMLGGVIGSLRPSTMFYELLTIRHWNVV